MLPSGLRFGVSNQPPALFRLRGPPRRLCTAAQQRNGPGPEEEAEKAEQKRAEQVQLEEKSQVEAQLQELKVRCRWRCRWRFGAAHAPTGSPCLSSGQEKYKRALADTENLRTRTQKMVEEAKLYGEERRRRQRRADPA